MFVAHKDCATARATKLSDYTLVQYNPTPAKLRAVLFEIFEKVTDFFKSGVTVRVSHHYHAYLSRESLEPVIWARYSLHSTVELKETICKRAIIRQ